LPERVKRGVLRVDESSPRRFDPTSAGASITQLLDKRELGPVDLPRGVLRQP
jgi:hypothetical protein